MLFSVNTVISTDAIYQGCFVFEVLSRTTCGEKREKAPLNLTSESIQTFCEN